MSESKASESKKKETEQKASKTSFAEEMASSVFRGTGANASRVYNKIDRFGANMDKNK